MTTLLDIPTPAKDTKAKPDAGAPMVCDFNTHNLGKCAECRRNIGGIGYRQGGQVVCFAYAQRMQK